jgi:RNA polymerase sigma factor (sigma-70 family)
MLHQSEPAWQPESFRHSSRPTKPLSRGYLLDDRPQDNVARAAAQAEIERALNTLTPRQREVLKLQFFEGLGHPEIAARLGMSRRSVKRVIIKSYGKLHVRKGSERYHRTLRLRGAPTWRVGGHVGGHC